MVTRRASRSDSCRLTATHGPGGGAGYLIASGVLHCGDLIRRAVRGSCSPRSRSAALPPPFQPHALCLKCRPKGVALGNDAVPGARSTLEVALSFHLRVVSGTGSVPMAVGNAIESGGVESAHVLPSSEVQGGGALRVGPSAPEGAGSRSTGHRRSGEIEAAEGLVGEGDDNRMREKTPRSQSGAKRRTPKNQGSSKRGFAATRCFPDGSAAEGAATVAAADGSNVNVFCPGALEFGAVKARGTPSPRKLVGLAGGSRDATKSWIVGGMEIC